MPISLAESAVKPGVEPKIGAARIRLTAARTDDGRLAATRLRCISDSLGDTIKLFPIDAVLFFQSDEK